MSQELISKNTLIEFREVLVGFSLREIGDEFGAAGLTPDVSHEPSVGGQRRGLVEQYYAALDLSKGTDAEKLLHAYENVLNTLADTAPKVVARLSRFLQRDGYQYRDGKILSDTPGMLSGLIEVSQSWDAPYLAKQIERLQAAANKDPELAIGTAKELLETCCKTILEERGQQVVLGKKLPDLVKATMKKLKLLPDDIPEQAKGQDTIRKLLRSFSASVDALAEIRNLYGSGHGKHGRTGTVQPRHARLAVGTATTVVMFLFETHQLRKNA